MLEIAALVELWPAVGLCNWTFLIVEPYILSCAREAGSPLRILAMYGPKMRLKSGFLKLCHCHIEQSIMA